MLDNIVNEVENALGMGTTRRRKRRKTTAKRRTYSAPARRIKRKVKRKIRRSY